jgi:hypothetical protein
MKNDPYENVNVIEKYPQVANKLQQFVVNIKINFTLVANKKNYPTSRMQATENSRA